MTRSHASSGGALLVGSVPGALGRTPQEEVLLIGLSEQAGAVAVILGTALDDDPRGTADELLTAAAQDAAHGGVVITYAADAADPRSRAGQTAAAVVLRAPDDFRILDALWVSGERWGSYLCPDPACCPADGHLITTPEEHHP